MKTANELAAERMALISKINQKTPESQAKSLLKQIQEIQRQEKDAKIAELVQRVNREQERLRESGALVYKVEQPGTDITTASGHFHAVRVKKYPNIQALGPYCSAKFSRGGTMYEVRHGAKHWTLALNRAGYYEGEKYELFPSFEDFLKYNRVLPEPVTVEQMQRVIEANEKAIQKMEEAEKEFSAAKEALNLYALSEAGLFAQSHRGHIYEFRANV